MRRLAGAPRARPPAPLTRLQRSRPGALGIGLVAVLGAVLVTGRAGAGSVVDMVGRHVAVPDRPARIISLAPNMTEILYAIGASERLVGVTQYCDYPPEARTKPKIGGMYTPSFEAILSLRPDLVLATTEGNREEDLHTLDRLGIPVYVTQPLDFATVLESIDRVGALLGREREAAGLVARMRGEAQAIARAVERAPRPRVLYVLWGNPLIVPGRDTLITDLLQRAGGDSITASESQPYPRFSLEAVLARRPEWIILARHGDASVDAEVREWARLTLRPAVQVGHVRSIDGDLVHRPGPRIVEGLRALAHLLHPDLVP